MGVMLTWVVEKDRERSVWTMVLHVNTCSFINRGDNCTAGNPTHLHVLVTCLSLMSSLMFIFVIVTVGIVLMADLDDMAYA